MFDVVGNEEVLPVQDEVGTAYSITEQLPPSLSPLVGMQEWVWFPVLLMTVPGTV